ncbi:histidinol-phosphate transaminase [Ruegeria sp. HKCCD7255]|uniref:pyridoxal phosphate-dependent aminotransferase n=1 Tax=Ruegeria sp. HKCCD7255 TaxID=2683004 RepID=UPI00148850DC|nr:histidinol-phosphate transaminase [Ruegeria sp. HKCCD7255]
MIQPVPHIAEMSPYALAQLKAPAGKSLISLSQNESLRPPSPEAIKAASMVIGQGHLYPDPDWGELRVALAETYGLEASGIVCGAGSMDLIACLARCFAGPQAAVLAPAHAYPFFRTAAQMVQARFDTAPERDGHVCVDALIDAIRPDTRLLFLANPGNPTGTRISRSDLIRLRKGIPASVLLVIDEAYGEFADHLAEPMFDLVARGDTVILRSLSKAYGLAAMRVGWGLFPPAIAAQMRKVMNPNNIPAASQAAAAAAVRDQRYMEETCALTRHARDGFRARLQKAGFDVPESFTNFTLIRFASDDAAQRADAALRAEGVFLRPQGGVGLGHCLRATIAAEAQLDQAAAILEHQSKEQGS